MSFWDVSQAALIVGTVWIFKVALTFVYEVIIRPRWMTRHIPGPKPEGFLAGHLPLFTKLVPIPWHHEFGSVVRTDAAFGSVQLCIDDKKALHHILVNENYNFPKPYLMRLLVASSTGMGLVAVEGDVHKRQRRILNPCFGPAQLKSLYPAFFDKALKLRDRIIRNVAESKSNKAQMDMFELSSRATLDVISSAGFGYETHALDGDGDRMFKAFNQLFGDLFVPRIADFVVEAFPSLKPLAKRTDTQIANVEIARETMVDVGREVVKGKRNAILQESSSKDINSAQVAGKDLLATLIRANLAEDLKTSQRLSEAEILNQISTFLVAGVDTTANALCWAIYSFCTEPHVQIKLRDELNSLETDTPSWEELNDLPYLDAVVRETLRLRTPVPATNRVATKDTIVPLSKPYVDTDGKTHDTLLIPQNTAIYIPILHLNTNPDVWGPDARDFKPERWIEGKDNLPEGASEMPSLGFPTFLAGHRACIGFRFSILELKTMIFAIVRAVNLELAVPAGDVEPDLGTFILRPTIKGHSKKGYQLPIAVSRL